MKFRSLLLLAGCFLIASCTSKDQIKKALVEDPSILADAIQAHPVEFFEALNKASQDAKDKQEKESISKLFDAPLTPNLRSDESIRGNKDAPIVLVEYSDFECPYCSRGAQVVKQLRSKYGDKIQFIYKHLPLPFHKQAMISAQYYEAIRLQSPEKAFEFHDKIFENQALLQKGPSELEKIAKSFSIDMAKLKKDLNSEKVKSRIEEDMSEAQKFGIQGTPGFVINGIPVKGAYPLDHFESILTELQKRGSLKI